MLDEPAIVGSMGLQPTSPPEGHEGHSFCHRKPPAAVARVKIHAGPTGGSAKAEIERVYGAEVARVNQLDARFAHLTDDETLLVSVGSDGKPMGGAWPVFRDTVSLQGTPDMSEAEAASLLLSNDCAGGLQALRQNNVRPKPVSATGGCAHCNTSGALAFDAGAASIVIGAAFLTAVILRRR
jgi:hypothetical protein